MRRQATNSESIIGFFDNALRTLTPKAHKSARPMPTPQRNAAVAENEELSDSERNESISLMRVNHSGEVAAQGLYMGQQLTARSEHVKQAMIESAAEEVDHLVWCETRIDELGGRTSILNPLWYAGSFLIGAAAGVVSDELSLGFVTETEKQVEGHLKSHLDRLPAKDVRSRSIVSQMMQDEAEHGQHAQNLGGEPLPRPVQSIMKGVAKVMTSTSHHF